jgi:hypothetical protein
MVLEEVILYWLNFGGKMIIRIIFLSLFLGGCAYAPEYKGNTKPMSGEQQAVRLIQCNALNLDYQVRYNNYQEVIDITCVPRYGHVYGLPTIEEVEKEEPKKDE